MDGNIGEIGFWVGVAIVIVGYIWSDIKNKQMKHELTMKLLEKGQGVDQDLLDKLLAADKPEAPRKSAADKRREESGIGGFIFLVAGIVMAVVGILGDSELMPVAGTTGPGGGPMMAFQDVGPNWLLVGLGAFVFLFGNWIIYSGAKEYRRAQAQEKADATSARD